MTEEEARAWTVARFDASTVAKLTALAGLVEEENSRQNLISPATVAAIWSRHIVDSLQLLQFARASSPWLDIGTGGGFPGLPVAIATGSVTFLVEPRKRRAAFLSECAEKLGLAHVRVCASKVEAVRMRASTISARAVAPVENILRASVRCATPDTRWVLPRGRLDDEEIERMRADRSRVFHVEQSLTDPTSSIVIVDAA